MEVNRGIYLLKVNSKLNLPLNSKLKILPNFTKFGKTEVSFYTRKRAYEKIYGNNFDFQPILYIRDFSKIKSVEKDIKILFKKYLITNPQTKKKLEWLNGIQFDQVKKIILKKFKRYKLH